MIAPREAVDLMMVDDDEVFKDMSQRGLVTEQIEAALSQIKAGGSHDSHASWRLVDALVELKQMNPDERLPGIDDSTGMGGKLTIGPPN